jgi:GT2 family glycosyltransferase
MAMSLHRGVNVYILTTFESSILERTVGSVLSQEVKGGWYIAEIVLIVNLEPSALSKEAQNALLSSLSPAVTIRFVFEPRRGIPHGRNAAVEDYLSSGSDWMAFIDDDCVADDGWLQALCDSATEHGAEIAAGSWRFVTDERPSPLLPKSTWYPHKYLLHGREINDGEELPHAFTRSVLFTIKEAAPAVQGLRFDESRVELGGSDTLYFRQLIESGAKAVFAENSRVAEYLSGRRVTFHWHFRRALRNTQFRLDRSKLGERISLPRTVINRVLAPLLHAHGFAVELEKTPKLKLTARIGARVLKLTARIGARVLKLTARIGARVLKLARPLGLLLVLMSFRVKSYRRV